jgi:hypothetical protein
MFHQPVKRPSRRTLSAFVTCVSALSVALTFANLAAAQLPDSKEPPVDRTFNVPLPGPDGRPNADVLIPAPHQGGFPVTDPYIQSVEDRNSQTLLGGAMPIARPPVNTSDTADEQRIKERLAVLQHQQEQLARAYQEALMALEKTSPRSAQVELEKQRLQTQLQLMKGQVAEWAARQQPQPMPSLPETATLKVFALRYVKPDEVGNILFRITGNDNMRMAFDERTNSLLLAGAEKQLNIAEALIERLDQPSQAAEKRPSETLQLRVVWLLDGANGEGAAPEPPIVSPQVVDALSELGFTEPRVMCQQLTTLTVRPEERRSGQFNFQVPVLVGDDLWQFSGQGSVANSARDKYTLDIGLTVQQRGEPNNRSSSELSGSIITPLAHYTVVGTTTFVATKLEPAEGGGRGKVAAGRHQHLAAFVVYLDRAREFGDESGKIEK